MWNTKHLHFINVYRIIIFILVHIVPRGTSEILANISKNINDKYLYLSYIYIHLDIFYKIKENKSFKRD